MSAGPPPDDLTALQLDVPDAEPLLDAVAREQRPGVTLLRPAHVSLGYPWLPPDEARAAVDGVAVALAGMAPLDLRFDAVERFGPDPRGRLVVHLRPEPSGAVRRVAALAGVELDRPHLSLARVTAAAAPGTADALAAAVRPLLPLRTVVRTATFSVRAGPRWRVEGVLHLGGGSGQ